MTLIEVEAIVNCPAGNYTPRRDLLPISAWAFSEEQMQHRAPYAEWVCDVEPPSTDSRGDARHEALAIRVWLDDRGRVIDKCSMGHSYRIPSTYHQIQEWLYATAARLGL